MSPKPHDALASDDSASFGGLADVLEPDADAITSLRRVSVPAPSERAHHPSQRPSRSHASLGRSRPSQPVSVPLSVRAPAPIQLQDFAFADTVVAKELAEDEVPPPSGPIYVNDGSALGGHTQCMTPLAFPLPPAGDDVDLATRLRVLVAHVRHAFRGSREEMRELWAGTAEMVGPEASASHFRRVLALWSFFQWSRADLTRAAMIGLAVFVTAAAIGATSVDFGEAPGASATSGFASSAKVRPSHTLDQHTGRKGVVHSKR